MSDNHTPFAKSIWSNIPFRLKEESIFQGRQISPEQVMLEEEMIGRLTINECERSFATGS